MKRKKKVEYIAISEENVKDLRMLNLGILPTVYEKKFYSQILQQPPGFNILAYIEGKVVGGISCLLNANDLTKSKLAITTLCVIPRYRGQHIATELVQLVLEEAEKHDLIDTIYLHVQTDNEEAVGLYEKMGFQKTAVIPNYYRNLDPSDCFVLSKCSL